MIISSERNLLTDSLTTSDRFLKPSVPIRWSNPNICSSVSRSEMRAVGVGMVNYVLSRVGGISMYHKCKTIVLQYSNHNFLSLQVVI